MDQRISVIITCKDLEPYLQECIDSVRGQTILPYETILIHDGCKEPMAARGFCFLQRDNNIGVAKTRDEGFRLSTGNLVVFVDADDMIPENFLEACLEAIKKGADVAYPDILLWRRWGENPKLKNEFYWVKGRMDVKRLEKIGSVVVTSLFKREVYTKVGGFDPTLEMWEDWVFWLQAARSGFKFGHASTYLKYRQRTQGRNQAGAERQTRAGIAIKEKYWNE